VSRSIRPVSPGSVRQAACPPQNQSIFVDTPLCATMAWLRMASSRVNSVSAVPWMKKVGMRMRLISASPGPRDSNQATSSGDRRPVVVPDANALVMCGSSRAPTAVAAA